MQYACSDDQNKNSNHNLLSKSRTFFLATDFQLSYVGKVELLNHISKLINKSYLLNASQILGRIPVDLTSLLNKLSVQLLSKFLAKGAILGLVRRSRSKNTSFLMSFSASIEFNSVNQGRSTVGQNLVHKKFLRRLRSDLLNPKFGSQISALL